MHKVLLSLSAYENSQNDVYGPSRQHRAVINHDGRPTIVDTRLTFIFKMGQGAFHFVYCLQRQPILRLWLFATCHPQVTQDTQPTIIDAPLTLIIKMGQGVYRNPFRIYRRPIICLWLFPTYRWCGYPGRITQNRWCSVDAHFQDEVGSMRLQFVQIKAAKTSIIYNEERINFRLQFLHDRKLLTLCWHSICHQWIPNMQSFNLA